MFAEDGELVETFADDTTHLTRRYRSESDERAARRRAGGFAVRGPAGGARRSTARFSRGALRAGEAEGPSRHVAEARVTAPRGAPRSRRSRVSARVSATWTAPSGTTTTRETGTRRTRAANRERAFPGGAHGPSARVLGRGGGVRRRRAAAVATGPLAGGGAVGRARPRSESEGSDADSEELRRLGARASLLLGDGEELIIARRRHTRISLCSYDIGCICFSVFAFRSSRVSPRITRCTSCPRARARRRFPATAAPREPPRRRRRRTGTRFRKRPRNDRNDRAR